MSAFSTRLTRGARACTASTAFFTTAMASSHVSASMVVNIDVVSGQAGFADDADGVGDDLTDAVIAESGRRDAECEEHAQEPAAHAASAATARSGRC